MHTRMSHTYLNKIISSYLSCHSLTIPSLFMYLRKNPDISKNKKIILYIIFFKQNSISILIPRFFVILFLSLDISSRAYQTRFVAILCSLFVYTIIISIKQHNDCINKNVNNIKATFCVVSQKLK